MEINQFFIIFSGLAWTIVYLDAIRLGIKQKSYAIPFWALALNIAWELLHAIYGYAEHGFATQIIINASWFILDCLILYTYFRFGSRYFPEQVADNLFYVWSIGGLIVAFMLQYLFIQQFPLLVAAAYAAFLQNLLMSILFIVMLVKRSGSEGQSRLIAYSKWLGTLAPTILLGVVGYDFMGGPSQFILVIGVMISLIDIAYIVMLSGVMARERRMMK